MLVDFVIVEDGVIGSLIDVVAGPSFASSLKHWVHDAMCPDPISQSFARGLYKQPRNVVFVTEPPEGSAATSFRDTNTSGTFDSAQLGSLSMEDPQPSSEPMTIITGPSLDSFFLVKCEYGLRSAPSLFAPDFSPPTGPICSSAGCEPGGVLESFESRMIIKRLDNFLSESREIVILPQEALTVAVVERTQPTTRRVTRSSSVMGSLVPAPRHTKRWGSGEPAEDGGEAVPHTSDG